MSRRRRLLLALALPAATAMAMPGVAPPSGGEAGAGDGTGAGAAALAAGAAEAAEAASAPPPLLALLPPPADWAPAGDGGVAASGAGGGGGGLAELPLSVQVRLADGVCEPLLRRGAALPAREERLFTTTRDSQAAARVELYVGERPFCEANLFLGMLELAPLPMPSYRSFVQLEVSVEADASGALICRAAEVEGRALGEPHCAAEWRGEVLGAGGPPPGDGREGRELALFSHALAKHLPVLLATRSVRLPSGRDVVIRQHQRREEERIGTGGVLWEAAIVLADYVSRNGSEFRWPGKRVLELGAGTGLVAISLALEGADVVATDGNPRVLEGARRNVEGAGELRGTVSLEVFDWNSPEDLARMREAGPWDAIVGSDLVYPGNAGRRCVDSNETRHPADETLLALMARLAGPETQIVIALKDRTGEVGRFAALAGEVGGGWRLERAAPEGIMPEFREVPAVAVLRLRRAAA